MKTGALLLLTAEFLFALSTVFVKFVTNGSLISGIEIAFFRFFTGFIITGAYIKVSGKYFPMVKPFNVYMRGLFNTTSVIFFFLGVQYTTISNTNLLNMTYPVFVFLISPFITKEKISQDLLFFLVLVLAGIYFIVIPEGSSFSAINKGDIFALLSGVTAGFGISFLREARKTDYTQTILLYMFAIGSFIGGIMLINNFVLPRGIFIFHIFIIAILSFAGQVLLTAGYKSISATAGSLVSSARIVFAIFLGVIFFSEPLSLRIISGSTLIIISLAGVNGFFKNLKITKKR